MPYAVFLLIASTIAPKLTQRIHCSPLPSHVCTQLLQCLHCTRVADDIVILKQFSAQDA